MSRVVNSTVVVASLVFTLGGAVSRGGPPPNPTPSDIDGNTAGGSLALVHNSSGEDNTAFGKATLNQNTSGSKNTALGTFALMNNLTGNNNTAVGVFALNDSQDTDGNTALGWGTLVAVQAGIGNTALGWGAGMNLSSGSQNIYLGHPGVASESNTLRLGSSLQTKTFVAGVAGKAVTGTTVVITSSGQLGVMTSAARYKRDIADMRERSAGLYKLRPVTFRYKADPGHRLQYGLIAEEVAKVYPELVTKGADGKAESVQYHELIPLLLNEVQRQQQEIVELKAQTQQVAELKAQNEEQRVQNATLAARVEQLEAAHAAMLATR